eukprot:7752634-Pyramimonas_sp.AAC.1
MGPSAGRSPQGMARCSRPRARWRRSPLTLPSLVSDWAGYFPRLKIIRAHVMFPHGVVLVSLYGHVEPQNKVFFWNMLEQLGVFLRRCRSPWIIAGDFNVDPNDIKLCRW